jgi:hypothetical protein
VAAMNKYLSQHHANGPGATCYVPPKLGVTRTEPVTEEIQNKSRRLAQQAYASQTNRVLKTKESSSSSHLSIRLCNVSPPISSHH